ncbi:MAG: DUF973 family protein [Clostridiales Family XIII bacterium]|jgi:uncharacterized membrane protein|nr:DUF973 family protein [Clostridiales Family XIII bacterium]
MDRKEFMARLADRLSHVPADEREDAVAYYEEYFDDAGPENEERVIGELGSPEKIAAQVKADAAVKGLRSEARTPVKKGASAIWLVVLGVLALPVAMPLAVAALAVIFALLVSGFAVVIAVAASGIGIAVGGVVAFVAGVCVLFASAPTGFFYMGAGLAAAGIALLLGLLAFLAAKWLVIGVARLLNRLRQKARNQYENKRKGGGGNA